MEPNAEIRHAPAIATRDAGGNDGEGRQRALPLKPILDGFHKLVSGLYEISNKASDRHARRYNPAMHLAKLAVNAAFDLCDFLVEPRDYQGSRDAHSTGADTREARA